MKSSDFRRWFNVCCLEFDVGEPIAETGHLIWNELPTELRFRRGYPHRVMRNGMSIGAVKRVVVTEDEKKDVAQKFLGGLRNRDWESMRSIMHADVVWSLPGTSLMSGEARGVEAVIKRAQMIAAYGLQVSVKHVLFGLDGVTLSLNNTAKRGELVFDEHLATVCSIREGKVWKIDTYLHDVEMLNTFFVPL
jgi:ketosteroid isomerase-like protein